MIKDIPDEFWERWHRTTDRPKLLRELPLSDFVPSLKKGTDKKFHSAIEHCFYTLINSYLEDLMFWVQKKEEK